MKYDEDYYYESSIGSLAEDINEEIPKIVKVLETCRKNATSMTQEKKIDKGLQLLEVIGNQVEAIREIHESENMDTSGMWG